MQENGPKRPWEERLSEASSRLRDEFQDELRRVVRFIDDEVVPEVRRNSSSALRAAASRLQKLAQQMDENKHASEPETKPPTDAEPR